MCILLTAIMFPVIGLKAQSHCEITSSATEPVCSESAVTLSAPHDDSFVYSWRFKTLNEGSWNTVRMTTSSIIVHPFRTTQYCVEIHESDSSLFCQSDTITVEVKPRFFVDFNQIAFTCSNSEEENGRTAQVLAWVNIDSSAVFEPPFSYEWQISPLHVAPGCDSLAIGLEAYKYYSVKVTDGRGCTQMDSTRTRAYSNPIVEITADPGDTVYLQNPHVTYSFENKSIDSIAITNFYWILNSQYGLNSNEETPRFTYVEAGDFTTELKVYNPQGCDTSYYKTIKVNPVKLKVPNVFTPNGDGVNDYFIISIDEAGGNIDDSGSGTRTRDDSDPEPQYEYENYEPLSSYYESTELVIFNRWGRIVFQSKDYQNDWDGGDLPDATYFYVLKCHGLKQDANYQGSVMIFRGSK